MLKLSERKNVGSDQINRCILLYLLVAVFLVLTTGCTGPFGEAKELNFITTNESIDHLSRPPQWGPVFFSDRISRVPYSFDDVWGAIHLVLKDEGISTEVNDEKTGFIQTHEVIQTSVLLIPLRVTYLFLLDEKKTGETTVIYKYILYTSLDTKTEVYNGVWNTQYNWSPSTGGATMAYCRTSLESRLSRALTRLPPSRDFATLKQTEELDPSQLRSKQIKAILVDKFKIDASLIAIGRGWQEPISKFFEEN